VAAGPAEPLSASGDNNATPPPHAAFGPPSSNWSTVWLDPVLHASLLVASSADTTCGGPGTWDTGRVPFGVSLALIRSQTIHLGGDAKRRQFGSHPSDFAGRTGPHKVPHLT
jgi:hypothetical protein